MKTKIVIVSGLLIACAMSVQGKAETCKAPLPPKARGAELSQKLEKCNGVLKPGQAADTDIVKPAPKVGDPMLVHPKDLSNGGVAK